MSNKKNNSGGFTLIELLAVVTIVSIISVVSLASWQSFSDSTALNNTAKMIETKIKLAKNYSLNALNDKKYGIRFEADKVTLFLINDDDTVADVEAYNLTDGVEIYNIAIIGIGGDETCNNNGITDNSETGIDCGGGGCPTCISNLVFNRLTGTSNKGTFGVRMINRPFKTKAITINAQGQTGVDSFEVSAISPVNNARHVHFNLTWDIRNISALHLKWEDNVSGTPITTTNITNPDAYFNVGKTVFDWSGTTIVSSVSQPIRIHSWLIGGNSVLCVMRSETENEKLKISFTDGVEKEIGSYTLNDATGEVSVTAGIYGGTIGIQ